MASLLDFGAGLASANASFSTATDLSQENGLFSSWFERCSKTQIAVTIFAVLIAYDQFMYIWRKGSIAGPAFKIPFMGPFIQALYPKFDAYLAQWASGPLSCVSVFHKFVVLASDRDIAHKVFKSPTFVKPCIVPMAETLLRPSAWVFLQGRAHTEYRRGLNGLFTNKAISTYLPAQEKVYDDYFERFVAASEANKSKPMAFMRLFREINCALSCRTFFGDYISQDAVEKIAEDFYQVTAALELVNVPLSVYIPFTKCWRGKRTADAVLAEFASCAAACKANMAAGAEPKCIVDQWVLHMMESKRYNDRIAAGETGAEKPKNLIREFTDEEIGQTMFTFLFASQDASSSATTWLFQILAQRPDVLDRLREENLSVRGGNKETPFELSMLESLPYTNAVIKELLRYRPPVIFVPYEATKKFPVTPNYTISKGSMIVPSCYPALHDPQVYPDPETFDPERWITGDAESKTKNWLVFGAGAHDCLARKYVPLTMAAMIGKASLELDWVHHATSQSEEIRVFATLFPEKESDFLLMGVINSSVAKPSLVHVKNNVEGLLEGVLRPGDVIRGSLDSIRGNVVHKGNPHLAHEISELDKGFRLALEWVGSISNTLDVVEDEGNLLEVGGPEDRREAVDVDVPKVSENGNVGTREGLSQETAARVLLEVTSEGSRSLPLETILVLRSADERGGNTLCGVIRVELGSSGDSILVEAEAGDPRLELLGGVDSFLAIGGTLIEVVAHQEGNVGKLARVEELGSLSSHEVTIDNSSKRRSRDAEGSGAVEDVVEGLPGELTEAVEGVGGGIASSLLDESVVVTLPRSSVSEKGNRAARL
ncbi:hypothetical protein HG531_001120 [Fusarium graminearum]|nr:hypothetical protein HG531_001120 [Fusarium graminearum]